MATPHTIVRNVIQQNLEGIAFEHRIAPAKILMGLRDNRKWRRLHEKVHAGQLTHDAFAIQAGNMVSPIINRHKNLAGFKAKPRRSKPIRPSLTVLAKVNKDGRVSIPREITEKILNTQHGLSVGKSRSTTTQLLANKDGRFRLTKTKRKEIGFTGKETGIRLSAFPWGVRLS